MRARIVPLVASIFLTAAPRLHAQDSGLDDRLVALTYYKVSKQPFDLTNVASRSEAVQRATNFDRPDVTKAEVATLSAALSAADPAHEFVVRVADNIAEYDHQRGAFTVMLFSPGYFVQSRAFGDEYRIVFDNAAAARTIPMAKAPARDFDARLNRGRRAVVDEIHFRVVGDGDPAGGVTGQRVVRATITSVRILDRSGAVLFTPTLAVIAQATPEAAPAPFDAQQLDVAGLRVGVTAKDFEATADRLFGRVSRVSRSRNWFRGYAAALEVNSLQCFSLPGRRNSGNVGNVCVTAFLDADDVVRSIRIERVFAYLDGETFRATMVRRYGAVSAAQQGGGYALGWGPIVDPALAYSSAGPRTALSAHYAADDDFMRSGLNAAPHIRVVLHLVDAAWASSAK